MSEMYACDLCGKPTTNFVPFIFGPIAGKLGRSWCDDCEKRFERELAWENEQPYMDYITCPWCGYEDDESTYEDEGEYEHECPCCGNVFVCIPFIEVTYTSKRRIEDMPEGWDGE